MDKFKKFLAEEKDGQVTVIFNVESTFLMVGEDEGNSPFDKWLQRSVDKTKGAVEIEEING
jgi:hypothetical protein